MAPFSTGYAPMFRRYDHSDLFPVFALIRFRRAATESGDFMIPRNPFKMFLYSLAANSTAIPLFYTCFHACLILCCDTFVSFITLGDTSSFGSFTNLRVINRIHSTVYYTVAIKSICTYLSNEMFFSSFHSIEDRQCDITCFSAVILISKVISRSS